MVNSNSNEKSLSVSLSDTASNSSRRRVRTPYFSDVELFKRVDKYLDDNIDKDMINKEDMVRDIRNTYKEYQRRNQAAFRAAVFKAYNMINQNIQEVCQDGGGSESDSDQPESGSPPRMEQRRSYLNALQNSTTKCSGRKGDTVETPINISSDDGEGGDSSRKEMRDHEEDLTEMKLLNPEHFPDINITAVPSTSIRKKSLKQRRNKQKRNSLGPDSDNGLGLEKRQKLEKALMHSDVQRMFVPPQCDLKSFGGYPKVIASVTDLLLQFYQSFIYTVLGVTPPRGFLLHGPPGCGKTLLATCVAGELQLPLVKAVGPELVGGVSGESEERIRRLFATAIDNRPCVLFIDEIDAICAPRESARKDMERRIVSQLISCLDSLGDEDSDHILVIGATNRPDGLDPALRRAGRFDKEVCVGIPDRSAREGILKVICSGLKLSPCVQLEKIAELTPGFVAADLKALLAESAVAAVKRIVATEANKKPQVPTSVPKTPEESNEIPIVPVVENSPSKSNEEEKEKNSKPENGESSEKIDESDFCVILDDDKPLDAPPAPVQFTYLKKQQLSPELLDSLYIEMDDVLLGLKTVQPSAKREGFATVPDVTWDDIGSLRDIRNELQMSIMMPVKYPKEFARMGVEAPSGIMLCGPPGCGKTLLAKAVANEANINFISVKGPELLNMYVGESEKAVRQCFQRARNSQPCVIFFDEIDALCPKRSDSTEGSVSSRVVNQMLTEMDGVEERQGVFLMAASNRPDMVDPAVLRPGRLDKILYVGLPKADDRVDILRAQTKNGVKPPLSEDVSLSAIGSSELLDGYSGADIAALVKEASVLALTEHIRLAEASEMTDTTLENLVVHQRHFTEAISKIRPSVNAEASKRYDALRLLYAQSPVGDSMDIP